MRVNYSLRLWTVPWALECASVAADDSLLEAFGIRMWWQKGHPSCREFDKSFLWGPGLTLSLRVSVSSPKTLLRKSLDTFRSSALTRTTREMDRIPFGVVLFKNKNLSPKGKSFVKGVRKFSLWIRVCIFWGVFIRIIVQDNSELQTKLQGIRYSAVVKTILPFFCLFLCFFWLLIEEGFHIKSRTECTWVYSGTHHWDWELQLFANLVSSLFSHSSPYFHCVILKQTSDIISFCHKYFNVI